MTEERGVHIIYREGERMEQREGMRWKRREYGCRRERERRNGEGKEEWGGE